MHVFLPSINNLQRFFNEYFVDTAGVDTNFEKLETVGLPTHNFQEPQVKFRSPNLFLQFDVHHQEKAAGVL